MSAASSSSRGYASSDGQSSSSMGSSIFGGAGASLMWDQIIDNMELGGGGGLYEGGEGSDEERDDVEDGTEARFNASLRDAVILLIDASAPMWQTVRVDSDDGEVPIASVLRLAAELLANKIIAAENDLVGVVLYGTCERSNPNDFDCVWVAQQLEVPDAHRIQELDSWASSPQLLRQCLGGQVLPAADQCSDQHPLSDALWTCSTMFASCRVKVGTRAIFLFTNEDDPHVLAPSYNAQVLQRCRDLNDLHIDVEFFPLLSQRMLDTGSGFRYALFWRGVLPIDDDDNNNNSSSSESAAASVDVSGRFDELRHSVRRKIFKKRSLARLPLVLPGGIELAVRLYNLVQETKKAAPVWLQASNNQPVRATTKWICDGSGQLLMPSQIVYGYPLGGDGQTVVFNKDELEQIKHIDRPGVYLMGFKPKERLKPYYQVQHSAFLYPDEGTIRGSTVAFAALLTQMWEMDRIAVARFTPRANAQPRFVALLPQLEAVDHQRRQVRPPGFNVVFLPFFEDLRNLDVAPQPRATREQVTAAKVIAKKLRIAFDPDDFENPALQKHYASLQALAVDKASIDPVVDMLEPDAQFIDQLQPLIDDFVDAVPGLAASLQRDDDVTPSGGRPKRSRSATDPDELDWDSMPFDQFAKQTVASLKSFCQSRGIAVPAKSLKADILQLIADYLSAAASSTPSSSALPPPSLSLSLPTTDTLDDVPSSADVFSQPSSSGAEAGPAAKRQRKQECMYGHECRRRNPEHFQQYQHSCFTAQEIEQRIAAYTPPIQHSFD